MDSVRWQISVLTWTHLPLLPDMKLYLGEVQNRSDGAKTQLESYLR